MLQWYGFQLVTWLEQVGSYPEQILLVLLFHPSYTLLLLGSPLVHTGKLLFFQDSALSLLLALDSPDEAHCPAH